MSPSAGPPTRSRWAAYALHPIGMAVILLAVLVLAALLAAWITRDRSTGPSLVIEKPTGGTIFAAGITCGTRGTSCTTTGTKGDVIELRVEPDDQYTFASYTGDCAPGGRVLMDGPHTCGATFEQVAGATTVRWSLTLTPPTNGTIFTLEGHACGTQGQACTAEVAEGHKVSLDVQAEEGYRVQSYTGDCVADGTTIMDRARTCGAVLVPGVGPPPPRPASDRTASAAPPGAAAAGLAAVPAGVGAGPVISPPRVENVVPSPSDPSRPAGPSGVAVPTGPAGPSAPPAPVAIAEGPGAGLPPGAVAVSGPPPPVSTPTELATREVTKVLQEYRAAHARMDVPGMKRLFPSVDVPRIEYQFRDLKSLKYAFAGDPKLELDIERGTAKAVVDVKTEAESKAGKKQKPAENETTFMLKRTDFATGQWIIEYIRYAPK